MLGAETMQDAIFVENSNGIQLRLSVNNPIVNFRKSCEQLEDMAQSQDYQRISSFNTYGEKDSDRIDIAIDVIKLKTDVKKLNEDINVPFVQDNVVGKWEVIGDYAVKYDFFAEINHGESYYGDVNKQIYFLPNGEHYWCYGWTKGFLILHTGDGTSLNSYEVDEHNGERYMFIQNKSYYYRRGGKPTTLVLHQLDSNEYTKQSITRHDNIDMPFVKDDTILGKWRSIYYLRSLEEFDSSKRNSRDCLYFKDIEFFEGGQCTSLYGNEKIAGEHMQVWTKGYVLRKWNHSACAYEIRKVDDIEYLLIEWKSGDYLWGGFDSDYYVFARDSIM